MSHDDDRLSGACHRVGDMARGILDWIGEASDIVAAERVALLHEVYRTETSSGALARALEEGPAVAVVGPARSGKTQLLQALVEPGGSALSIRFEGIREQIGLQRYLLPEGARSGIACTLRLTTRERPASQNFPVVVRLLAISDILKLLGALFISGAEAGELEPVRADIDRAIARARAGVGAEPVAGLSEEDVWDVRHYFCTRFGEVPLVRALLTSGYWESLTGLVTRLPNSERAAAFSVLWGGNPRLTAVFATLADAILALGAGREARAALDAVLGLDARTGRFQRRPDSILSAAILSGLGSPDADTIVVSGEHGQWVSLPRPVVAAIVAEVRLPLADAASELATTSDLLELPAIEAFSGRDLESAPGEVGHAFMRAKAGYLMERLTDEQAITALAVCIDPSASPATGLASLVANWVERSHGVDAAARERQACGLFVCLSRLDKEFQEPSRRTRERRTDWQALLTRTLVDGLGATHRWVDEWTPGRAFDNLHVLRLPGPKVKHLIAYSADGREIAFKPEQTGRIERARRDFLACPLVERHVADPATVWSEAFELNDGGATLLAQSLADVCDRRTKERQILADLAGLGRGLGDRLRRYHRPDDVALAQDRRRIAALVAVRWLRRAGDERRLGRLLRGLQLSDDEFHDVLARHDAIEETPGHPDYAGARPSAAANGHAANGHAEHHDLLAGIDTGPSAADAARTYAALAMTHWVASVRLFADAQRIAETLHVPRASLLVLVDELVAAAGRLDLEGRIATAIEDLIADVADPEARRLQAALVSASLIGDFVMWLGFDDSRSNAHPRRKGRAGTPIFPPRDGTDAFGTGATDDRAAERAFRADWSQAFLALVADNAADIARTPPDTFRNRRLGELLAGLDVTL
jgi:hypothetical protein